MSDFHIGYVRTFQTIRQCNFESVTVVQHDFSAYNLKKFYYNQLATWEQCYTAHVSWWCRLAEKILLQIVVQFRLPEF